MNLIELAKYLMDEDAAEDYLIQKGILKNFTQCPYCNSRSIGKIRRGRMKCYKCKKEWHRRKGSFLESRHITYSKFIGFLKLYSEERGITLICHELGINIKHGLEINTAIRSILFVKKHSFNSNKEKVFLWANEDKAIQIEFEFKKLDRTKATGYLELIIKGYKEFGGLYSFLLRSHWKGKKIRYKNLVNSFISYVKMKSVSYRGIHKKNFYEYLFEQVIRFNLRDKNFYEELLKNLRISKVAETTLSHKNDKSE